MRFVKKTVKRLVDSFNTNLNTVGYFNLSFLIDWVFKRNEASSYQRSRVELRKSYNSDRKGSLVNSSKKNEEENNIDISQNEKKVVNDIYKLLHKIITSDDKKISGRIKEKAIEGFDFITSNFDFEEERSNFLRLSFEEINKNNPNVFHIFILSALSEQKEKAKKKTAKKKTPNQKLKAKEKKAKKGKKYENLVNETINNINDKSAINSFTIEDIVRTNYERQLIDFLYSSYKEMTGIKPTNLFNSFYRFLLNAITAAKRIKKQPNQDNITKLLQFSIFQKQPRLRKEAITFTKNFSDLKIKNNIFPACFVPPKDFQDVSIIDAGFVVTFLDIFMAQNEAEKKLVTSDYTNIANIYLIKASLAKIKGIDELWAFLDYVEDKDAFRQILSSLTIFYKSFGIKTGKGVLKGFGNHLVYNIVAGLKRSHRRKNYKAVDRFLFVGLKILGLLKGQFFGDETANMKSYVRVTTKRSITDINTHSNATLLEVIRKYKEADEKRGGYVPKIERKKITFFSALEQITVFSLANIQGNRSVIVRLEPIGGVVDLAFYQRHVFGFLARNKDFYEVVLNLLDDDDKTYRQNLYELLKILPPHESFTAYFRSNFAKPTIQPRRLFKADKPHMFSIYINHLLGSLEKEKKMKKNAMGKLICSKNHYNSLVGYLLVLNDEGPSESHLERRIRLAELLAESVNFQNKPITNDQQMKKLYNICVDMLKEININGKNDIKRSIAIITKLIITIHYLKNKKLNEILKNLEEKNPSFKKISEHVINGLSDSFKEFPPKELKSKELKSLFEVGSDFKKDEFTLVYSQLYLKTFTSGKTTVNDEVAKNLYSKLLTLHKNNLPSSFVFTILYHIKEVFGSKPNLFNFFSTQIFDFLDFHFFQINKKKNNYDLYLELLKNKEGMVTLFEFVTRFADVSPDIAMKVVSMLNEFTSYQKYRTNSQNDWNINRPVAVSSFKNNKFRGLRNLGNTCYINSSVQQLYMIEEFVSFIIGLDLPNEEKLLQKVV